MKISQFSPRCSTAPPRCRRSKEALSASWKSPVSDAENDKSLLLSILKLLAKVVDVVDGGSVDLKGLKN